MSSQSPVIGSDMVRAPIADPKTGMLTPIWQRALSILHGAINAGLNQPGNFIGTIAPVAHVAGHVEPISTTLQNIGPTGKVTPAGLPAATPTQQGAVVMPAGALNNNLGTASIHANTDFDIAGSAAAAQAAAQAFAANGSNISSGTVAGARVAALSTLSGQITTAQLPASGLSVTIATAKLTGGGTNGSMTFTNGILTAQTPAT